MILTLEMAQKIVAKVLSQGAVLECKPLTVVVLDGGGHSIAMARSDGASTMRPKIAHGKAYGAIAMGIGSRAIFDRAQEQAYFVQAMNELADGALVPVPGGVLIRDSGQVVGAVGVTGDTSDNDEACAIAAIEELGLVADPG